MDDDNGTYRDICVLYPSVQTCRRIWSCRPRCSTQRGRHTCDCRLHTRPRLTHTHTMAWCQCESDSTAIQPVIDYIYTAELTLSDTSTRLQQENLSTSTTCSSVDQNEVWKSRVCRCWAGDMEPPAVHRPLRPWTTHPQDISVLTVACRATAVCLTFWLSF